MENTLVRRYVQLALAGFGALTAFQVSAALPVKVGGQLQFDIASFQGDSERGSSGSSSIYPDTFNTSAEVRRAEIYLKGELKHCWSYQIEWDAKNSRLTDSWIGYSGLPVWIAFGRIEAPQGLENWTSDTSTTFMERAAVSEAFAPEDGLGLYFEGKYSNWLAYAGAVLLPDHTTTGISSADPLTGAARVTFAPYNHGDDVLHFGGSFYYRDFDRSQSFTLSSPPEVVVRNTPNFVTSVTSTTGVANQANDAYDWGLELAGKMGPMLLQGEYQRYKLLTENNAEDLNFRGWYVQASYVITGESRTYDQQSGTFGRVKPNAAYGAWEAAIRYSELDLSAIGAGWTDNNKRGEMEDWTLGLNYYASKNIKFQFNYVRARASYEQAGAVDRNLDIFAMRGQLRF